MPLTVMTGPLVATVDIQYTLKQVFDKDKFRPLQEDIIKDALVGRDLLVLLPTGHGKSLTYLRLR